MAQNKSDIVQIFVSLSDWCWMWVKTSDQNAAQDSPNALETSPGQVHPPSYRERKNKQTDEPHEYMIKDSFTQSMKVGLLLFISIERTFLSNTRVSQIWCVHPGRVQRQRTQWLHSAEDNPRRSSCEWCTQNLHTWKYVWKRCNVNLNSIWNFGNRWLMMSPGPMPTLMMSAPARISSSTISPVTTLPAYNTNGFQNIKMIAKKTT